MVKNTKLVKGCSKSGLGKKTRPASTVDVYHLEMGMTQKDAKIQAQFSEFGDPEGPLDPASFHSGSLEVSQIKHIKESKIDTCGARK